MIYGVLLYLSGQCFQLAESRTRPDQERNLILFPRCNCHRSSVHERKIVEQHVDTTHQQRKPPQRHPAVQGSRERIGMQRYHWYVTAVFSIIPIIKAAPTGDCFGKSGIWESNPPPKLGKLMHYRCANAAGIDIRFRSVFTEAVAKVSVFSDIRKYQLYNFPTIQLDSLFGKSFSSTTKIR